MMEQNIVNSNSYGKSLLHTIGRNSPKNSVQGNLAGVEGGFWINIIDSKCVVSMTQLYPSRGERGLTDISQV